MSANTIYRNLFNSQEPILVGFSTEQNLTSFEVNTLMEEVNENTKQSTQTIHLNIEENKNLAKSLGIAQTPGFVLFDQGRIKWRKNGTTNSSQVKYLLNLAHNGRLDINDLYGS